MHAFVVMCLLATAVAAPQGYNYQQQQHAFQLPGIPQISAQSSTAQQGNTFLQQALQTPKFQQSLQGHSGGGVSYNNAAQPVYQPQQQQPLLAQQLQQQQYQQAYNRPGSTVTKDIYVHVAPEEPNEQIVQPQLPPPPPRKHYRIVFIKAPSPSISKAALRVQQAPTEEKTIIYVLTKKPDPLELQTAFEEAAPKPPSKPEVYFIKYKTQEEAQHAQRTIQAQYDQLGGTTQVSDEGVAPVTSVIGALDNQQQHQNFNAISGATAISNSGAGASKYLPPIVRI